MLFPIIHKKADGFNDNVIILAGDIGGSKSAVALIQQTNSDCTVLEEKTYRTKDFAGLSSLISHFMAGRPLPSRMSFGVAGPVKAGKVKLTNQTWIIDSFEISKTFRIAPVCLINDLEAAAYGLAALKKDDLFMLQQGETQPEGNMAIIAPGTGLGEAGLYWDGKNYHPFATEGGHCDFAPRTELDIELYHYIQKKLKHVSWEHLISGPGICTIYEFLLKEKSREEPAWLRDLFLAHDPATMISRHAGECSICTETMELFLQYLAEESANLVLKLKATGGLFIGGGILPEITKLIHKDLFHKNFCDKGRMKPLLETVPLWIILNKKTPLLGAAFYGLNVI